MGFLKNLFGDKGEHGDELEHVDPETGFEHAWTDEERHRFCMNVLEGLKERFGGELRKTDDDMRLYMAWKGRPVVVGAVWYTGDLVVNVVGKNRLGPIGLLRDETLDEDGDISVEDAADGWGTDTELAGAAKEYVADGIYLEATQEEVGHERKRLAAVPEALRAKVIDAMQNARLQSIFSSEDGLDFTWERSFFRVGDLASVLGPHLELSLAVYDVFATNPDPDPKSPNAGRLCSYCHTRILDAERTKCENCGGVL